MIEGRIDARFEAVIELDIRLGYFDTVELTIHWHERELPVRVQILDEALIGTKLLRGSRIRADWIQGGQVQIESIG